MLTQDPQEARRLKHQLEKPSDVLIPRGRGHRGTSHKGLTSCAFNKDLEPVQGNRRGWRDGGSLVHGFEKFLVVLCPMNLI